MNIAYGVAGEGPPLVFVLGWASHLEFRTTMPGYEDSFFNLLAQNHQFVSYDGRGFGLSDRGVTDFSVENKVRDLEAVVDAIPLDRFALLGMSEGGPTSIVYTHRHPDRVSKLILVGTFARIEEPKTEAELAELRVRLLAFRAGWEKGTPEFRQLWGARFMPDAPPGLVDWFNEMGRQASDGATMLAATRQLASVDVTQLAREIKLPTLIVHARGDRAVEFERGRALASLITGARLAPVEGNNHIPVPGDRESLQMVRAIEEFLGIPYFPSAEVPVPSLSGTAIILFADIADSTALTEHLGDVAFRGKARDLDTALRTIIREHGGTAIEGKLLGDGVLAVFTAARDAITAALACRDAGRNLGLDLHLGLHAGDVIREEGNVFGGAVNIASRISALSAPGEVLVSDTVRSLARTSAGVSFEDRGEQRLKGVEDPIRLFEVR
jgi:class 3 adenylate cyclase/pimeloyl-ACP methyl ester carboxylesterase